MYSQTNYPYPSYGGFGYQGDGGQTTTPGLQFGGFPQASTAPVPGFAQQQQPTGPQVAGMLPLEQSFIENIFRLNRGKVGTFYMTFENNDRWNAKVFKGVIEAAGRDHLIISDPQTGKRYLLLMVNLDYVTFDEEIAYDYPSF